MTQEELKKLIAQQYGNVLTAGQALTSQPKPIPTANVAGIDPLMGQAGNVAANIATGAQGFFGGAGNVAANIASGAQPFFGQAGNVAANIASGAQPFFGQASGYLSNVSGSMANVSGSMANASQMANASTAAYDPSSYQSYMDPYQQEVLDRYSQEMQRQFDISQQQRAGQAIGAGAFGGGREGVYQAEGLRGFQEQLGTGIAGLLSKGYTQAQQMAQQNFADRMKRLQGAAGLELAGGELGLGAGELGLGAGQAFGQLGTQYGATMADAAGTLGQLGTQYGATMADAAGTLGNLGSQFGSTMANTATTLGQLGLAGQQAQQSIFDKEYQNQIAQYMQPYDQLTYMSGLLGGAAPSFMRNPATEQGNPLLAGIGALGGFLG